MPSEMPDWVAAGVDIERPNVARIYDYLLGGGCNFKADREFAHQLLEIIPEAENAAQQNRAYLRRAVRFCVAEGIHQFLDLGSGIPTVGNVHEIAQQMAPECRVVYVDNEPVAVAHSELMLEGNDRAGVVLANLLDVDVVLNSSPAQRLLDFTKPVALLMVGVLHYIPDSADPWRAVARYLDAAPSGSYLAISHAALVEVQRSLDGWRLMDQTSAPGGGRPREQVEAFLTGTDLVPPGLVWTPEWRPDPGMEVASPELAFMWAAVGRKP
jgi:S-adenosyl methyltransferase